MSLFTLNRNRSEKKKIRDGKIQSKVKSQYNMRNRARSRTITRNLGYKSQKATFSSKNSEIITKKPPVRKIYRKIAIKAIIKAEIKAILIAKLVLKMQLKLF